ncbi:MAG: DUF2155 domain-containing protein [Alphaproteobacteria bacterium]|nr:DUF2155 domain-containing protein [Alphaproteobacteria bacterium]
MKKSFVLNIVVCFVLNVLVAFSAFASDISMSEVVLHGLDKITGRLSTMTIKVGEKEQFGALDIYVRVCNSTPPEETPENTAFLEIIENHVDGQSRVFSGWMFSSSPSLSAMEHPVYDIWVVKCSGEPKKAPRALPIVLEHEIQPKLGINKFKFNLVDMEKEQKEKKEEVLKQRLKTYSEKTEDEAEETVSSENEEEQIEELKETLLSEQKDNEEDEEQEKSKEEQEATEETKEDIQVDISTLEDENKEQVSQQEETNTSVQEETTEEKVEDFDPTDPDNAVIKEEDSKKTKD